MIYNANRDPKSAPATARQFNPFNPPPKRKPPKKEEVFSALRAMVAPGAADPTKR